MSEREESFDCTVTAGTAAATPMTFDVSFDPGEVVGIELVFPDGCAGLVGAALGLGGQQVIPFRRGRWYTGNMEVIKRDTHGYLNSGSWSLLAYNTDINDHTLEVRFSVNEIHVGQAPEPGSPEALTAIPTTVTLPTLDGADASSPSDVPDPGAGGGLEPETSPPADDSTPATAPDVGDAPGADVPADDTAPDTADAPDADTPDAPAPDLGPEDDPTIDVGTDVPALDFGTDSAGVAPAALDRAKAKKKAARKPATKKKAPHKTAKRTTTRTETVHGADKAVAWARSRIGHYAENTGRNTGTELDELERLVGLRGEPWCAIFATTAVVHGGLPRSARTAGVGTLADWAKAGTNGYRAGLLHVSQARHGDLVIKGSEHTGIVESNAGGRLVVIEGNTSRGVVERNAYQGSGPWTNAVRPKYPDTHKKVTVRVPAKDPHKSKTSPKGAKRAPAKGQHNTKDQHKSTKRAPATKAPKTVARKVPGDQHTTHPEHIRKASASAVAKSAARPAPKPKAPKPPPGPRPRPAARPAPRPAPAPRRAPAPPPPPPPRRAPAPAPKKRR